MVRERECSVVRAVCCRSCAMLSVCVCGVRRSGQRGADVVVVVVCTSSYLHRCRSVASSRALVEGGCRASLASGLPQSRDRHGPAVSALPLSESTPRSAHSWCVVALGCPSAIAGSCCPQISPMTDKNGLDCVSFVDVVRKVPPVCLLDSNHCTTRR